MFNPFNKKKDEFKLDDIKLPSLNDTSDSDFSLPSSSNNDLSLSNDNINSFSSNNDLNMSSTPSNDFSSPNLTSNNNVPDFSSSPASSNINPMLQSNPSLDNNTNNTENNSANQHQEITRAQIETMISKLTLLDARQQNMEQKLDLVYQIILNEVSEDTKRKLNIDSMMNSVRNR